MDYAMIGKIEKAVRYASEPERITFHHFTLDFKGDNSSYVITYSSEGWDCTCDGFRAHGICPHIMAVERHFEKMLKRPPLPYAPGQNVVSDIEKAVRYAEEPDRFRFINFDVTFKGDNGEHHTSYSEEHGWDCSCDFYKSRATCCHTMALERILKGMIAAPSPV
jgi:nuclear transport factor 2 (NTF2) superfamily protein